MAHLQATSRPASRLTIGLRSFEQYRDARLVNPVYLRER